MRIPGGVAALIVLSALVQHSQAQSPKDSLPLTLPEAEKIFLQKNLDLIANRYNIDINKAYLQQAKYWDNPVLNTDQNIYDGKFFRHDANYGQVFIQIEQLIKTGGKRNKLIRLSNDAVLNSEQQFDDLMRNLRFLLRNDFFSLHEMIETATLYERESSALQGLVKGMDAQLQSGNISLKENVRVKSLLYSLRSEQADLQTRMEDLQKDLRMLLQISADTSIVPSQSINIDFHPEALTLQQLMDSARINRPDLQIAKTNLLLQQHNLAYQKALAVPDLTLAVEYDQRSSYINNYYGLGISLPIPVLNTNKGNIRAAAISGKQAESQVLQVQQQAALEVAGAYNKLLINTKLSEQQPLDLAQNYERLLSNMISSYAQRQVGLLEFIDFFDAYKDAKTRQLHLDSSLRSAAAELDFTIGTDLINLQ